MAQLQVRALPASDHARAVQIINAAAAWYREFLPPEEAAEPEMTSLDRADELLWYGAYHASRLIGVAALEHAGDAALLRHAYVLPDQQQLGAGSALTRHLEAKARELEDVVRIVVGTYAANYKARRALEKLGYLLSSDSEAMLRRYYRIAEARRRGSVTYEKPISSALVYGAYDQAALDAQYEQRTLVPDLSPYYERWRSASAAARVSLRPRTDLAYGPSAAEKLDLFTIEHAGALVAYLHGGAWRLLSKEEAAYPAPALAVHRISLAAVDFAPVPAVTLQAQIAQCRSAIAWLYRNAQAAGADRICLLGHSSGAHLAAMLVTTDWEREEGLPPDVIKGAVLVSGIYDLEPVRLSARNEYLRLDERSAIAMSPARRIKPSACRLVIAWGDGELAEFRRQSRDFAAAWHQAGNSREMMPHRDMNHFDMSFPFAEPAEPLHRALVALARGGHSSGK